MSGHGHVTPNKNGFLARCGGPGLCSACNREAAIEWKKMKDRKGLIVMPHQPSLELLGTLPGFDSGRQAAVERIIASLTEQGYDVQPYPWSDHVIKAKKEVIDAVQQ